MFEGEKVRKNTTQLQQTAKQLNRFDDRCSYDIMWGKGVGDVKVTWMRGENIQLR